MMNRDIIDQTDTRYDMILGDNFLAMFHICNHEFEWLTNNWVLKTLFEEDVYDALPPLFVTCVNCAGLYPAPRYIELL